MYMSNLRLFIGVALSPSLTERISPIMDRLASELPFRKWTHPADLHVTLHFLGDTPEDRVDAVAKALEDTAANTEPMDLRLTEPGTFGPPAAPRILWLGLTEPSRQGGLTRLHAELAPKLAAAGCRLEDRPFRAHLTLARQGGSGCTRAAIAAAWQKAAPEAAAKPLEWTADRVTLFLSHLGKRPSYEKLREFPFRRS